MLGIAEVTARLVGASFEDVVALVGAVAWPLSILVLLLVYRRHLPDLIKALGSRISRISWASVSVEFAVASEVRPEIWSSLAYLRDPTSTQRVPDSSQALFLLIKGGERADSATIDFGTGTRWLTSRLYVFALILSELLGVRCLVFLETRDGVARRFVGLADPLAVRSALARQYSWFETALFEVQLNFFGLSEDAMVEFKELLADKPVTALERLDADRVVRPLVRAAFHPADLTAAQPAEAVATAYLRNPLIHREVASTAPEEDGWVRLGPLPEDPGKVREEHARWIRDGVHLDRILGDALLHPYIVQAAETSLRELQKQAVLQEESDFVAVIDGEGRFKRLLNRRAIVDRLAQELAESAPR